MNRTNLWIVTVVVAAWIGFLLGYAMSSHTAAKPAAKAHATTGGYGKAPEKGAGQPGTQELKKGSN